MERFNVVQHVDRHRYGENNGSVCKNVSFSAKGSQAVNVSVEKGRDRGDVGFSAFRNNFHVFGVNISEIGLLLDVKGAGDENNQVVRLDDVG